MNVKVCKGQYYKLLFIEANQFLTLLEREAVTMKDVVVYPLIYFIFKGI